MYLIGEYFQKIYSEKQNLPNLKFIIKKNKQKICISFISTTASNKYNQFNI